MRLAEERGMTLVELLIGMIDLAHRARRRADDVRRLRSQPARERHAQRHDRGRAQRARHPGAPAAQPRQARVEPGHRHARPVRPHLPDVRSRPHVGALLPQHDDGAGVAPSARACGPRELAVASSSTASPVTAAMRATCPGTGWTTTQVVADYVTNRRAGTDRPMFEYACTAGTTCTATPATYDQVVDITRAAARRHDARLRPAGAARHQRRLLAQPEPGAGRELRLDARRRRRGRSC